MPPNPLDAVDRLKRELDALRPLPPDTVARVAQKLRIDANYHSNVIEGNSLTLGETRSLILHGLTARGKPMRDHIDIQGHDDAVKAVEDAVSDKRGLTQEFIRNLHRVLLREPYDVEALAPDGARTKRKIQVGAYKTAPNNVKTSTGETYFFTPPERVQMEMTDLLDWVRRREEEGEHPVILAATFHYRFVRIHPFDDGNGRMARLLMNMILIRHGYAVAIVRQDDRERYIGELERIDRTEQLAGFIEFIASCCEYTLNLHLRAARGESIEDPGDIDREIALFKAGFQDVEVNPRIYAKETILPFFLYVGSKIKMISPMFVSMSTPIFDIKGRGPKGKSFKFEADFHQGLEFPYTNYMESEIDKFPQNALRVRCRIIYRLFNFRERGIDCDINIIGKYGLSECIWELSQSIRGHGAVFYKGWCDGQDLIRIEACFDDLLRSTMRDIGKLDSPTGGA